MAHDLIALGCTPRKSLTLEWPNELPDQYASHFVRGYFDGDGCIHFNKDKRTFIAKFTGSVQFIESLQIYVKQNVLFDSKAKGSLTQAKSCSNLVYEGNPSPMTVLNWMYKDSDASIRLDRKHAQYVKFLEISILTQKQRFDEMNVFLNSDMYKTLIVCQHTTCCPHLYPRQDIRKHPKQIQQINKNDASIINVWENVSSIQKSLGFRSDHILTVCRGTGNRKSAYGYFWKFLE
eukprot:482583_1